MLTALMLTLVLRSSEVHLTIQQKQRGTLLVLGSGLCCGLILSGGILWFHASQASSRPVSTNEEQRSQPSFLPTPESPPHTTPLPTPTPFPVLTPSTAQVLTTWCTAINRHDTATVWQQYS